MYNFQFLSDLLFACFPSVFYTEMILDCLRVLVRSNLWMLETVEQKLIVVSLDATTRTINEIGIFWPSCF